MKQKGFTIIELLLAMTFFSFILTLVVTGFIQINRSYTRGLTVKKVQNTARQLVDDMARSIRSVSASDVVVQNTIPGNLRLCIGSTRYAWNMPKVSVPTGNQANDFTNEKFGAPENTVLINLEKVNDSNQCNDPILKLDKPLTLIEDSMMVQYFNISRINATNSFKLSLVISTNARVEVTDFTELGENARCKPGSADQFCDVAKLETVVTSRN